MVPFVGAVEGLLHCSRSTAEMPLESTCSSSMELGVEVGPKPTRAVRAAEEKADVALGWVQHCRCVVPQL